MKLPPEFYDDAPEEVTPVDQDVRLTVDVSTYLDAPGEVQRLMREADTQKITPKSFVTPITMKSLVDARIAGIEAGVQLGEADCRDRVAAAVQAAKGSGWRRGLAVGGFASGALVGALWAAWEHVAHLWAVVVGKLR